MDRALPRPLVEHARAAEEAVPSRPSGSPRRSQFVAVAADLFAAQGFKGTTVRQIAEAAGVLSGSLYHHFESKEAILDELLGSYLRDLLATYRGIAADDAAPDEVLGALVAAAFDSLARHRAAVTVLQNESQHLRRRARFAYVRAYEREVQHLWLDVLNRGIANGTFRRDSDAALIYRFIRDAIWVAVKWFRTEGPLTPADLAQHYGALVLDGIRTPRRAPAA
ncbi:MAG: TetR/AcrR family transcriptional regulator [Streptomycetaceae bacterium]|nr:TetR/AcrR family transcriptional regulator [Streptomycetaceae bacterium]